MLLGLLAPKGLQERKVKTAPRARLVPLVLKVKTARPALLDRLERMGPRALQDLLVRRVMLVPLALQGQPDPLVLMGVAVWA